MDTPHTDMPLTSDTSTTKKALPPLRYWRVGGCVRDRLLGLPVHDRDYVVVGVQVQDMLDRGFRPVGRDFPVFLHPTSHEEYALARTERKTAPGYQGFVFHADPSVSLEEDLQRRDFTINAMAEDDEGRVIDLFGGQEDLRQGVLRHLGPAFSEDPLRILRGARLSARLGFTIAPETLSLMRDMVNNGEVLHLAKERVWQELSRGLMSTHPGRMFAVLHECGALEALLPSSIPWQISSPAIRALEYAAKSGEPPPLPLRCALWLGALSDDELEACFKSLAMPNDCRHTTECFASHRQLLLASLELSPEEWVTLLEATDALRFRERFLLLGEAGRYWYLANNENPHPTAKEVKSSRPRAVGSSLDGASLDVSSGQDGADLGSAQGKDLPVDSASFADTVWGERFAKVLVTATGINAGAIAKTCKTPAEIKSRLREARLDAIRDLQKSAGL